MRKTSFSITNSSSFAPRGRLFVLLGLGVATWAGLIALFGGQTVVQVIATANPWWLLLAAAVHYSSFAVRGHRWQQLLGMMGRRVDYFYTTGLLIAGWFVSALLPARAGDFMRIGVLRLDSSRHAPIPVADSLGSVVLERALDILAIVGLGLVFGWAVLQSQAPGWLLASYAAAVALLMALIVVVLLAPPVIAWLRRWSQRRFWQALLDFGDQLAASLRLLLRRPRRAALVTIESLYIWLCDALVVWFVLRSINAVLPFEIAAFVALTVDVLAAAPITPGGVGQIDAAYAAIFSLLPATTLGSSAFNIGAAVLLVRFITYWSFLVFSGLVTVLAGFGELLQRLRSDASTAPTAIQSVGQPAAVQPTSDPTS